MSNTLDTYSWSQAHLPTRWKTPFFTQRKLAEWVEWWWCTWFYSYPCRPGRKACVFFTGNGLWWGISLTDPAAYTVERCVPGMKQISASNFAIEYSGGNKHASVFCITNVRILWPKCPRGHFLLKCNIVWFVFPGYQGKTNKMDTVDITLRPQYA